MSGLYCVLIVLSLVIILSRKGEAAIWWYLMVLVSALMLVLGK